MTNTGLPASWAFVLALSLISLHSGPNSGASRHPQDLSAAAVNIQLEPVLTGLSSPVHATHAGDGSNRLFIVEQPGTIKVLQPGDTSATVFLDIGTRVLSGGEQGLLGLAFHPDYENNNRFFLDYTRAPDGATVVAEYRVSSSNPNLANTTETVLLVIPQPFANHNGGMVAFGPDGYLYVGMGDGGSGNDPGNMAQNVNELLGKILRIDVDHPNGTVPYSSPSDNPFFGSNPGRDEIYALGVRNPWRFSFDQGTGQLYVGDVGQSQREEVDIVTKGGNYGWRVFEGTLCTNNDPALCSTLQAIHPITEYGHTGGRCSITGGYVYRGHIGTLPTGAYIFADFCTGEIFMYNAGVQSVVLDTAVNISSFGEDEAGEIYVVGLGGTVDRIVNPTAPCAFEITPATKTFSSKAGSASVLVTTPAGCPWMAMSNSDWITITSGSTGAGRGTVSYSIVSNTGITRTGTLTVAGKTFTVNQAAANGAQFIDQSVPTSMAAGQSYNVAITMRNIGTDTWTAGSLYRLGAQNPHDNVNWGFGRVDVPGSVAPGSQVKFTFTVTAPSTAGTYNFQWRMLQEFVEWFGDLSTNVAVNVVALSNSAQFISESVPTSMTAGGSYNVSVTMRNTGTTTWTDGSLYRLGAQSPHDNVNWGFGRVDVPISVSPGAQVTFNFTVTAPSTGGTYNFQWRMLREFVEWFGALSTNVAVNVGGGFSNSAQFVSQSVPTSMTAGSSHNVSVTMKNTGTSSWTAASVYRLGAQNPHDNINWGFGRVDVPGNVAPGAQVTFSFTVTAPSAGGTYNFQWRMLRELVEWFGELTPNVSVTVSP